MSSTRRKDVNLRIAGMDLVDSILAAAPGVVPENIEYGRLYSSRISTKCMNNYYHVFLCKCRYT